MTSPFNPLIGGGGGGGSASGLTPGAGPPGSSPFPIPNFSSPFPQLLPHGTSGQVEVSSPFPFLSFPGGGGGGGGGGTGLTPGPSGAASGPSPFNLAGRSGLGLTPTSTTGPTGLTPVASGSGSGSGPGHAVPGQGGSGLPTFPRHLQNLSWSNSTQYMPPPGSLGPGGMGSGSVAPPASSSGERLGKEGHEDLVRGLKEAERLGARAKEVLSEIRRLEDGMFEDNGKGLSEGMEPGLGGMPKIEVLCLEYTQLLGSLLALSNSSLFGALPVPLNQATPSDANEPSNSTSSQSQPPPPSSGNTSTNPPDTTQRNGNGTGDVDHPMTDTTPTAERRDPTLAELTAWAESKAALEFKRKEAIKGMGRAVLDVLKTNKTDSTKQ